jgi:ABC-2 type transport system permease protein
MKLGKVRAIAVKEYRQAARDPLTLAMLLGLPTMMLLLYGYAVNFDVRHVRLAIEDRDKSAASRELASAFVNSGYFDLVADLQAGADLARLTERREAAAILIVPENYGRDLAGGRLARAQLVLDGADANTATTILGYATAVAGEANLAVVRAARGRAAGATTAGGAPTAANAGGVAPIDYEPRVWYNPELKTTQFLVPGLIGFILMLTAVLSTAMSVVREKERGTMEQLRVSSLSAGELLLGKTLPYLSISLAATTIILLAARVLFGVVVRGSYLDLFIITFIYLVGALGLGLLVSSIAILLSGFIFPIRSMPVAVQVITYAVPARYFLVALRGVILKGAGLAPYGRDVAFLVAYALAVLGLAFARLSRKEV